MDFRQLERLRDRPSEFLAEIERIYQHEGLDSCIRLIKAAGVLVDPFQPKRYSGLRERVLSCLEARAGTTASLKRLRREISAWEKIFSEFNAERDACGLNGIPRRRQIAAYLLALEMWLGSARMYWQTEDLYKVKSVYPFVVEIPVDKHGRPIPPRSCISQLIPRWDSVEACCPVCSTPSPQVHSHYTHQLRDLPLQGCPAELRGRVRPFRCLL